LLAGSQRLPLRHTAGFLIDNGRVLEVMGVSEHAAAIARGMA
jgi:hypothetical protein